MSTPSKKRAKLADQPKKDDDVGNSEAFSLDENVQVLVTLEYHGTNYGGWQRQGPSNSIVYPSVQGTLEAAATKACQSFFADCEKLQSDADNDASNLKPVSAGILIPTTENGDCSAVMSGTSGRTDRAVHALDHHCLLRLPFSTALLQSRTSSGLANFLVGTSILPSQSQEDPARVPAVTSSPFLTTLNDKYLPPDIHVLACRILSKPQRKNLKFGRKRYRYYLQQCPVSLNRPWPAWNDYTLYVKKTLNVDRMQQGLQYMIGTHDFLPLSGQKEKVNTVRTLYDAKLTVLAPPFSDGIPWFVRAYQKNKTIKKKERKKNNIKTDDVEKKQSGEIIGKRCSSTGSPFLPPHYGGLTHAGNKHFPRPEDCKLLCIEFDGNGFLRHQVRRMISILVKIGEGAWDPDYVLRLLKGGDTQPLKGLAPSPGRALWKSKVWIGDAGLVKINNSSSDNIENNARNDCQELN